MTIPISKTAWEEYCAQELSLLKPILTDLGFTLEEDQPNLKGERFLQQAVTTASGRKFILFGKDAYGSRVVIKATRDTAGQNEIKHDRLCRKLLNDIDFTATMFHTPQEIVYTEQNGFLISIQAYIDQQSTFIERPTPEQFTFALAAFKAQEGAHATTYKHIKDIARVYEIRTAQVYLNHFKTFKENTEKAIGTDSKIISLLNTVQTVLKENESTIDQYGNFLTHTDFVPHNFRIDATNTMYLLDHSSLAFGNKYEGWARFLNFMALYNPELEKVLTEYVANNRSAGEQKSLWLMRMYRLGEIIWYYQNACTHSEGNLLILNQARVIFWSEILSYIFKHETPSPSVLEDYKRTRDSLRSEDEKERQKKLH